jgi:hypothetical protein
VKLLTIIDSYVHFEIDDQTGKVLTPKDLMELSNRNIQKLQQIAYKEFNDDLKDLVFSSVGELTKKKFLLKHIELLTKEQLLLLDEKMQVVTDKDLSTNKDSFSYEELLDSQILISMLISSYQSYKVPMRWRNLSF